MFLFTQKPRDCSGKQPFTWKPEAVPQNQSDLGLMFWKTTLHMKTWSCSTEPIRIGAFVDLKMDDASRPTLGWSTVLRKFLQVQKFIVLFYERLATMRVVTEWTGAGDPSRYGSRSRWCIGCTIIVIPQVGISFGFEVERWILRQSWCPCEKPWNPLCGSYERTLTETSAVAFLLHYRWNSHRQ